MQDAGTFLRAALRSFSQFPEDMGLVNKRPLAEQTCSGACSCRTE